MGWNDVSAEAILGAMWIVAFFLLLGAAIQLWMIWKGVE